MKGYHFPIYLLFVLFLAMVLVSSCVNEPSIPTQTPSPHIAQQYPTTQIMVETETSTPGITATKTIQPIMPYPTDFPPAKMTIWEAIEQTRVAALQSPIPPPGGAIIGRGPTPDPIQLELPSGTPMGDGVLTKDVGMHMSQYMGSFHGNLLVWVTETGDGKAILVYAGVDADNQEQGLLYVVREGTIWQGYGEKFVFPTRSGKPTIIDAIGSRLIIKTEDGDTFYFDVPAGQFAATLTEILPTMTPGPTLTPRVTPTFPSGDDVTNWISDASMWPINEDLKFFINTIDDEDWFQFYLPSTSDIVISLRNLPAPYGLVVIYGSGDPVVLGQDIEPSLDDKVIQAQDAEAGYYIIGVGTLTDAFSSSNPYTLRFTTE